MCLRWFTEPEMSWLTTVTRTFSSFCCNRVMSLSFWHLQIVHRYQLTLFRNKQTTLYYSLAQLLQCIWIYFLHMLCAVWWFALCFASPPIHPIWGPNHSRTLPLSYPLIDEMSLFGDYTRADEWRHHCWMIMGQQGAAKRKHKNTVCFQVVPDDVIANRRQY